MVTIRKTLGALTVAVLLGLSMQASAIEISLEPSFQATEPGEFLIVEVVVSDFGATGVGAYDIDIGYDPTVLFPLQYFFTDALGFPAAFGEAALPAPGIVDVFELSFLSEAELLALQGSGPLLLGILVFGVGDLAEGAFSALDLSVQSVAAADGTEYTDVVASGMLARNVPTPGTFMLLALGLVGLRLRSSRAGKI